MFISFKVKIFTLFKYFFFTFLNHQKLTIQANLEKKKKLEIPS